MACLEGARAPLPTVDRATGVLVASFNVSTSRAHECLPWLSEQSGTDLPGVADRFMARVDAVGLRAHRREALPDLLAELAQDPEAVAD